MDVGAIHGLVTDLNFETYSVPILIRPVEGPDIVTTGIWVTPVTDGQPPGFRQGPRRMEASKIMALKAVDAAGLLRDSRIIAPDGPGGVERVFRIEGPDDISTEKTHFRLIRDTGVE